MRSKGLHGHRIASKYIKISKWVRNSGVHTAFTAMAPGSFQVKFISVVLGAVKAKNLRIIYF